MHCGELLVHGPRHACSKSTIAEFFAFEAAPVIEVLVSRVPCGDGSQGAE